MNDDDSNGYVQDPEIMERGEWVQDEDGLLYIVPAAETVAEIIGPDDAVAEALTADMCVHGTLRDETLARFGLQRVPSFLRRFDAANGYYVA